ncbi:MAG: lysoplasmalogenase [Calditrichaeota bacterium]|nr:lysoplasmalogenase [Calditrichota bacterium]
MVLFPILSILILICATVNIRAEYLGPRGYIYVFKPLTTILILVLALVLLPPADPEYRTWIVLGLLFSLAGDIFLMLPSDKFIQGLISFLIAHIFYLIAFTGTSELHFNSGLFPFFLCYGAVLLYILMPVVSKGLRWPVIVYALTLLLMGSQAVERWHLLQDITAFCAAAGGVLFIISDSLLALNRFRKPFHSARLLTLSTYFLAQWLIALSVHGVQAERVYVLVRQG